MSRPLSDGPATRSMRRRRRGTLYDDLPEEMKRVIQTYLGTFTNQSLRVAVNEYFEDKAVAQFKYGKINAWDMGRVTDMSHLFEGRTDFNDDITAWDTSSVVSMQKMFFAGEPGREPARRGPPMCFNQDIGSWDTSSVIRMDDMFNGCCSFQADVGAWNTSSVQTMRRMFAMCRRFNGFIGAWDISSVRDLSWCFAGCFEYAQDISAWDVSSVTCMDGLFCACKAFNVDIGAWDTSSVRSIAALFAGAVAFDQDLSRWDMSSVRYTYNAFQSGNTNPEWSDARKPQFLGAFDEYYRLLALGVDDAQMPPLSDDSD